MSTYVAMHEHGWGADAFLFMADWFPAEDEIVEALGINFEPHKGESLRIVTHTPSEIIPLLAHDENGNVSMADPEDTLRANLQGSIDGMLALVNGLMPDKGDKCEDSQKVCILNALHNLGAAVNGLCAKDFQVETVEGEA
ncbi:hypothetical protein [Pseudodesulfovibrio pelocollis]|uniref:hypothetical protein n=1 Tax=Pseudodesulfovibrio pelocollis TaxID=3051432 RepID=UPI00255A717D|nr:hypothetical protein [Pseudodesulfovibrio sp. SB368]